MRLDCKIDNEQIQLPYRGAGRYSRLEKGDVVVFDCGDGIVRFGRVFGRVTATPDPDQPKAKEETYIGVAASYSGAVYERWVKPEDIIDCCEMSKALAWLFSPKFLNTPTDKIRSLNDLTNTDYNNIVSLDGQ